MGAGIIGAAGGVLEICFSNAGFDYRDSNTGRGLHLALGPSSNVRGRLLWQQRFLTVLLDELLPALQNSVKFTYVTQTPHTHTHARMHTDLSCNPT